VLSAFIQAGRTQINDASEEIAPYVSLTLGGLTGSQPRELVNWVSDLELTTGNEVVVRVVDVGRVDEPQSGKAAESDTKYRA
jgi:hypothetical protein